MPFLICSVDRYGRLGVGGTPDILPPGVFIGAVPVPLALLHDAYDRLPCGSSGLQLLVLKPGLVLAPDYA